MHWSSCVPLVFQRMHAGIPSAYLNIGHTKTATWMFGGSFRNKVQIERIGSWWIWNSLLDCWFPSRACNIFFLYFHKYLVEEDYRPVHCIMEHTTRLLRSGLSESSFRTNRGEKKTATVYADNIEFTPNLFLKIPTLLNTPPPLRKKKQLENVLQG